MALPAEYWDSFDETVTSITEFLEAVRMISAYQSATNSRFVWRGAADADWPLYSSLTRAYIDIHGAAPLEPALREFERAVIEEARDWGLDWHESGGKLSALELLAALQHYGVPTRILDFTFNPLIACWFAVESQDGSDGRVFAIDISDRLVRRENAAAPEPWWWSLEPGVTTEWATQAWVWRPPPFEARIVRQDGCFVMGGVPSTQPARNRRTGPTTWQPLRAADVRACMSIPFRLIQYAQAVAAFNDEHYPGAPPKARAFTLRIAGDKSELRKELAQSFGHTYRSLFPDYPGLKAFGKSFR